MRLTPLSRLLIDGRPDDAVIARRRGVAVGFGQFRASVAAVAAANAGSGRVALLCQDSCHFAAGFLGLLHAGVEVVLPPNGQPGTLESLSGSFERVVDDAAVAAASRGASLCPITAEAAPVSFFTSGSTGAPKRVTRSLAMLEHEIAALDAAFGGLPGSGQVLATVSHQHLYGLTFKVLWPLAAGRGFAAETQEVWEAVAVAGSRASVVVSSPAHLSRLGGLAPLSDAARPAAVFSAGAPLAAVDAWAARDILGALPIEIFGSTESGAVATRRQPVGEEAWTLLPGVRLRCDADGMAAFQAPHVAGWVASGDVVLAAAEGFHFLGRADGVVKIEGKRIALAEVEAALMALPLVQYAATLLLPGPPARLAAAVVPSAAGWRTLAAEGHFRFGRTLARGLAARLEPAGRPKSWRFVTALPQRNMGKRDGAGLAALFAAAPA